MKEYILKIFYAISIILLLNACGNEPISSYFQRGDPIVDIEPNVIEDALHISLLDVEQNKLRIGSEIWLRVDNIHSDSVAVYWYYGIKIFKLSEDGHILEVIGNEVNYDPNNPVYLDPVGGDDDWAVVVIDPEIINEEKEVTIYVSIIGQVYIDGGLTNQNVNGKIILTLTPE